MLCCCCCRCRWMSGATRGQPPPPWHMNSHTRGPHKLLTDACWGQGEAAAATRTRMRGGGGRAANSGVNAWTCSPRSSRTEKQRGKNAMIRNVNICTEPRRDSVPFARGPSKKRRQARAVIHMWQCGLIRRAQKVWWCTYVYARFLQRSTTELLPATCPISESVDAVAICRGGGARRLGFHWSMLHRSDSFLKNRGRKRSKLWTGSVDAQDLQKVRSTNT